MALNLTSSAFENQKSIPAKYTCNGENVNPPLQFSGIPEKAKSLALIMDDPDAPNGTWVHWLLWNINPQTQEVAENSFPAEGVQGITSFGKAGYGGPCPPSGIHRYFFKLYALDAALNLPANAKKEDLEKAIQGHIVEQAQLIGLYTQQK